MESFIEIRTVYEGHDTFNIFPIKWVGPSYVLKEGESTYYNSPRIICAFDTLMNILDDDLGAHISWMLNRHYHVDINYQYRNTNYSAGESGINCGWYIQAEESGFDRYSVFDVYSYESIREMIEDIKTVMRLVRVNPWSKEVLRYTCLFKLWPYERKMLTSLNAYERQCWIQRKVGIALDFYTRFIDGLEHMMNALKLNTLV